LAWQLQQAGYTVELDVWDWAPGEDFVARMSAALERADRLLAVCTEAYFASVFGGAAQSAATQGRIVPVLVEPVTLPRLYATLIQLDLTGPDEAMAAARLRDRLAGVGPTGPLPFPPPELGGRVGGQAGALQGCGGCRPAIRGSPGGTACSPSCGGDCTPGSPPPRRRARKGGGCCKWHRPRMPAT
jgi:hypothetical protein